MGGRARAEVAPRRAWRKPPPRGSTQRQRLLGAIMQAAARDGYRDVVVADVIVDAGVSRRTFYAYFDDKEECFLAALAPPTQQLLAHVRRRVARGRPEHAARAAIAALVAFARAHPADARLLLSDSLAGGARLRDARDELIDEIALIVAQAHARLPASAVVADLPPSLICGVTCRLLTSRLRRGEPLPSDLAAELCGWLAAYELPVARHRWRTLSSLPWPARSPFLPPSVLRAPPPLAPGRPPMPKGAVAENHWLRIVLATAGVIRRDGYGAASVAQISDTAGVESRAFYRLFAGKQQALDAACELLFTRAMAVAAGAFVSGDTWPQRVWEASRALIQYAEENPTLTYVSLVESHAGGSCALGAVADVARAFTIFLQEGYPDPHEPPARSAPHPSGVALEAIVTAAWELGYRHLRECGEAPLSALLARIVFISLAPFLGCDQASEFVRISSTSSPALPAPTNGARHKYTSCGASPASSRSGPSRACR